jgi:DNA-directed RNA polymerase subunit RPC12/RpoP
MSEQAARGFDAPRGTDDTSDRLECPKCGSAMGEAARLSYFPTQRFYRCASCRNVEIVDLA